MYNMQSHKTEIFCPLVNELIEHVTILLYTLEENDRAGMNKL